MMESKPEIERFIIRVYGILMRDNEVLITQEGNEEFHCVKFPGGGVRPGEGLSDALQREFAEELGITIQSQELFYVNDFFQRSAFEPSDQLISVYYRVSVAQWPDLAIRHFSKWGKPYSVQAVWVQRDHLNTQNWLPIDQKVVTLLLSEER